MPRGGQLSAGSGIRLQATTPGVTDLGNEHISGTIIADTAMGCYGPITNVTSNMCFGLGQTFNNGGVTINKCRNSVFIGGFVNINQNPNGNLMTTATVMGYQASVYQGECVVIGANANSGSAAGYPESVGQNVVIGKSASSVGAYGATDGEVILGAFSTSNSGAQEGSVHIGWAIQSNAGKGHNFVLGKRITVNGNNNVLLGVGGRAAVTVHALDNTIVIGNNTHTKILIGGFDFSNGMAASAHNVADGNYVQLVTDNVIQYTSITAPRTVQLVAANAVPNGFRIMVLDSSGAASAVNTITINRAGADTINGAASTAIAAAYGVRELQSDGVSKWTIVRSL